MRYWWRDKLDQCWQAGKMPPALGLCWAEAIHSGWGWVCALLHPQVCLSFQRSPDPGAGTAVGRERLRL